MSDHGWIAVGRAEEWTEEGVRLVAIGARRIGVYRRAGAWYALKDLCPHAGGPLHEGRLRDGAVACPWHGWAFDLATGRGPGDARVATYPVRVRDGIVELLV